MTQKLIVLEKTMEYLCLSDLEIFDTLVSADGAICERRLCTDSLNRSRVKPVGKQ